MSKIVRRTVVEAESLEQSRNGIDGLCRLFTEGNMTTQLAEKAGRMTEQATRRRVFSGVQPSGDPQLGNYIGAFKRWAENQDEKENFFCVVDLHAITVDFDPEGLRRQTRELAAILFACGIDPDKSTLFVQSHVTTHAEGCWILNCVTPVSWLERMTQYKDNSAGQESVSTGLLDYPVLMAGDILMYSAHEGTSRGGPAPTR